MHYQKARGGMSSASPPKCSIDRWILPIDRSNNRRTTNPLRSLLAPLCVARRTNEEERLCQRQANKQQAELHSKPRGARGAFGRPLVVRRGRLSAAGCALSPIDPIFDRRGVVCGCGGPRFGRGEALCIPAEADDWIAWALSDDRNEERMASPPHAHTAPIGPAPSGAAGTHAGERPHI